MPVLLNGKDLAIKVKREVREQAAAMRQPPGLAVILVGDDPASRIYVNGKKRDCGECGIISTEYHFDSDVSMETLLDLIERLNADPATDGILCQLPLPDGMDENRVLLSIDPGKDVDCFHPYNTGLLLVGKSLFQPCTPAGIMRLLEEAKISPEGKRCVVVGRSNIVGKPMGVLLLQANGTVTWCHTYTPNLKEITLQADILVTAVGKRKLITADMIREGAVVVDVAMNHDENGKLCGDVDYAPVAVKAFAITPVPGGVGPMTRAMLMVNTLNAAKLHGK